MLLGGLAALLALSVGVNAGFETLTDEVRYSPDDAREVLDNLPPEGVRHARTDFDSREDRPRVTFPARVLEDGGQSLAEYEPGMAGGQEATIEVSESDEGGRGDPVEASAPPPPALNGVTGAGSPPGVGEDLGDPFSSSQAIDRLLPMKDRLLPANLAPVEEEQVEPYSNPHVVSPPVADEVFDTVLLIGEDASGKLADTIIMVLLPTDDSPPAMVSIPRDLYIPNPCTRDYRRVNANLWGCGEGVSGPELLAVTVEDFTGVASDHYVRVNFAGFVEVVDNLGGIEICLDHPTRDENAGLEVGESGCILADGTTSLAYARSRKARQLVDGQWERAWDSDFTRQVHQRELLLGLADRLTDSSLLDLVTSFQSLSHAFRLDKGWSVTEAVGKAWRYRDLDLSEVRQLTIPVDGYETPSGEWVVVPSRPFSDVLAGWWTPTGG